MAGKINYYKRDFEGIRSELINYAKSAYDVDFTPASIDLLLVEIASGVGDMLSFNTDRKFQETQLENVQEKKNLLAHARTLGLHIPNKKPSITVVEFSVQVPPYGDMYDKSYLPIIKTGAQVTGAGQIFETTDDVDFSSDYSSIGIPNRKIIPNIDNNNVIKSYTIVKQEIVKNGVTKIGSKIVTAEDYKPFMTIVIPEDDVISIEQVILLNGTNYTTNPTLQQFLSSSDRYYEVDALAEDKLFVEDIDQSSKDIKAGKYITASKKFIKEYTESGFCKIIFGGGTSSNDIFNDFIDSLNLNIPYIQTYLNNDALGEIPKVNSTIFYRYRVGGGSSSNIGKNVLTGLGTFDMIVNGVRQDYNNSVKNSLTVNNPIFPALGGADEPSIEQIRRFISYNFSSQNRCVTTRDYLTQVFKMPGKFGAPFRVAGREESNKIILSILSLNDKGQLNNTSNDIMKENIAEYLSKYRMMNDYIEIEDGKIINLAFEIDLLLDKAFNRSEVNTNVINVIKEYMDISKHDMNENIYLGNLTEKINNIPGVLNIIDIRVYNKVGGDYSLNEINQPYVDESTRQIALVDYTIFGESNSMFEIKSTKDIILRNKTT